MADTKVSALSSITPLLTDILYVVDDPGGTPVSAKMAISALQTLLEGNLSLSTSRTTSGTFADARIAESNVTQHQAALSIAATQLTGSIADARVAQTNVTQHEAALTVTESQISDLGSYLTTLALGGLSDVTITSVTTGELLQYNGSAYVNQTFTELGFYEVTSNDQTGTAYTLVLSDAGKTVYMNNASANTLTIPTNASVAFPSDTVINIVMEGAGATTVTGDTGVTVNGVSAGSGAINTQYQGVTLQKRSTDTWIASGDIATVA